MDATCTLNLEVIDEIQKSLHPSASPSLQSIHLCGSSVRQPLHTVYGGAHLFKADTISKIGSLALKNYQEYAPNFLTLAQVLNYPIKLASTLYQLIEDKLHREPVEDYRIDFEDGLGPRPEEEEDQLAFFSAQQVVKACKDQTLPPYLGIRPKSFSPETFRRSVRTMDIFLSTYAKAFSGEFPANFLVTLPKVQSCEEVKALARLLSLMEKQNGLPSGHLKIEIMIETPQAIFQRDGRLMVPSLVDAAEGRCFAVHLGPYDFTAACEITAKDQTLDHPLCDMARHLMKLSLQGRGVFLSDGPHNVMPIGPYKGTQVLGPRERQENQEMVHRTWKASYDLIRRSLRVGFYQGWDLHPAQLPIRYAASYAFFLQDWDEVKGRLQNFLQKAFQATLTKDIFDDAATGQGLINYGLRAYHCRAISKEQLESTGLTLAEIQSHSFQQILENRRNRRDK